MSNDTFEQALVRYRALAQMVIPVQLEPTIVTDPDDDLLIACIVGGNAYVIVWDDKHLLEPGRYENILIQDIHQFLAALAEDVPPLE